MSLALTNIDLVNVDGRLFEVHRSMSRSVYRKIKFLLLAHIGIEPIDSAYSLIANFVSRWNY